jgi:transcriptional regulator GlxA family with amidase domain
MSSAQRYVVVVFDGVSLGIMSFAFGVFDLAAYYGVLPDIDVKVVSGEDSAALTGGGLACPVPYDLDAIRTADLVIIPNWRDPAEPPPPPLLEALRAAHAQPAVAAAAGGLLAGRV